VLSSYLSTKKIFVLRHRRKSAKKVIEISYLTSISSRKYIMSIQLNKTSLTLGSITLSLGEGRGRGHIS